MLWRWRPCEVFRLLLQLLGNANEGKHTLDKETFEVLQSLPNQKCKLKCAAQERLCGRSHLLQPPPPLPTSRLSAMLVQGLVAWSRGPGRRVEGVSGDSALYRWLLSFLLFAKNAYKAAIAQVDCGGEPKEGVAKVAAIQSWPRLLLSKVDQGCNQDCFVQMAP